MDCIDDTHTPLFDIKPERTPIAPR